MTLAVSRNATDTARAHAWFHDWMFGHSLPFWATQGHEGPGRGACEYLHLDGSHGRASYKRMRVQARQIYCFAHCASLGWAEGERLAREGYAFITRCGELPSGGWVRRLSPDGDTVMDPTIDLYDQAFVLLALAWYARLTGESEPASRARRTVDWICHAMAAPHGGFANELPLRDDPRQQNPHMHLLEAALALHEATGEPAYARLATALVGLFQSSLFDPATATLGEFFQPDWSFAPGVAGQRIEPGHHFEWVCLLDQYERQIGRAAIDEINQLYRFAVTFGVDENTGLVLDAVDRSGAVLQRSARLWPQTEALKAHAVMARRTGSGSELIPRIVANLQTRFLAAYPAGTWIDQLDADYAPASDKIPTSSMYHLVTGYAELDRYAKSLA